jgi:hypothetical protein
MTDDLVARLRDLGIRSADLAADRIEALTAEQDRLREALKPFADEAEHWEFFEADEPLVEAFPKYDGNITVGDLRNALAALKGQQP